MTNRDIEDMKNRIDELAKIAKDKENENAVLKQQVKTQREKIDSLLKELEEEKGKTITISDGAITMRADMWEALNENKAFKDENTALKQRVEYLKNIFEKTYASEKPEDVMRKTGLFSEEEIQAHMRSNETIWKNMKETISENAVSNDTLIAKLQYQHQQDCIRINDLTTTVHVLAGLYSTLRKDVGMD